MSTTAFCEQCGAQTDRDARFCTSCGAEQHRAAAGVGAPDGAPVAAAALAGANGQPSAARLDGAAWGGAGAPTLPMVAGLPLELWAVIAAFAIPGGWLAIDVLKALPDAIKAFGADFLGFRFGLAFMIILVLLGFIGAAMLAIAWRLYRHDRVGRGLAYVFAGTIVWSVALSDSGSTAATLAMVFSLVGIAILAFAPRVRSLFDRAASPDGEPTSVIVCATVIAVFSAFAALAALTYLLLASADGKYVVAALVAAAAAVLAMMASKRIRHGDRNARLYLSIGGAVVAILLLALGRSATGLLFPGGLIVGAIAALWLPNDARAFFGDTPIDFKLPS